MSSYIQLICLIVSFCYGACINYANRFNLKLIRNKMIISKFIIVLLYIFNMSLLYVVFLYKINDGMLHHYFVLFIILGYYFIDVKKRKL